MSNLNSEHLRVVIEAVNCCPFFQHMSMKITNLDIGYARVVMDIGVQHMNPFGGPHGGVYASVIDTAAFWSAYCDLAVDKGLISLDLNVDFLAPASCERIFIVGKRIKAGKTISLAEATMFNSREKILAHGTSKLMVTRSTQSMNDVFKQSGSDNLPPKFLGG